MWPASGLEASSRYVIAPIKLEVPEVSLLFNHRRSKCGCLSTANCPR